MGRLVIVGKGVATVYAGSVVASVIVWGRGVATMDGGRVEWLEPVWGEGRGYCVWRESGVARANMWVRGVATV